MVIMHMNYIRAVLPFTYPIHYRDLESSEPQCVIIIAINFFPVKNAKDIYQIKVEAKLVGGLFYNSIFKPVIGKPECSFILI